MSFGPGALTIHPRQKTTRQMNRAWASPYVIFISATQARWLPLEVWAGCWQQGRLAGPISANCLSFGFKQENP